MARPPRVHLAGGFYHVTLRGNHQQDIFREDRDRALLNAIVERAIQRHSTQVHAYCWMSNHLHFCMRVSSTPLGPVMRDIASNYARAFQLKLPTTGHLFERRYHATLIDVDSYLLEVVRYIHLNPVEARMVSRVSDYHWSSHRAYAGGAIEPWLTTDFVLGMLAPTRARAHAAYRRFVEAPAEPGLLDKGQLGVAPILGSDRFIASVAASIVRRQPRVSLEGLVAEALARFGIPEALLISASRAARVIEARAWIAVQAMERGIATLSEVARFLGRDRATLRHAMRKYGHLA